MEEYNNIQKSKYIIENSKDIIIEYKIKQPKITIFGNIFVGINKKNCIILIEGKEFELKEELDINQLNLKNKDSLIIKLKIINKMNDLSYMFKDCKTLLSVSGFSNSNNINNNRYELYVL